MRKIYDYLCQNENCSAEVAELMVRSGQEDEQVCSECNQALHRLPPAVRGWAPSAERTSEQLQERSFQHSMEMARKGHDPTQKDNYHPSESTKRKRRVRNTQKGMVARHQDDWKRLSKDAGTTEKITRSELGRRMGSKSGGG